MKRYECEPLTANHLPVKFGEHRHCGSGDMFSICLVTSHYQAFKQLWIDTTHGKYKPC